MRGGSSGDEVDVVDVQLELIPAQSHDYASLLRPTDAGGADKQGEGDEAGAGEGAAPAGADEGQHDAAWE